MKYLITCSLSILIYLSFIPQVHGQDSTIENLAANKHKPSDVALIDSLLQEAHRRGIFNGNALVVEKDTVVYQAAIGYANGSREKKLTPDLRFRIGSIAKEFDCVGIMMLKEQGKLKLDDKLSEYFPGLPSWANKISIKNLMQYTSGLPADDYKTIKTDEDAWEMLYALEALGFEPGTDYNYNNNDVFLRKRIIEKVSGIPYNAFLEKNILKPSGMVNAVVDPVAATPKLARAFDNKFVEDEIDTYMSGWPIMTAHDLYKWAKHLHSYQLISKASLYKLFEGYNKSTKSPMGLGIFEDDKLMMHWHAGSSYNYEASLYVNLQDDIAIVLMTNNKNFNVGDLTTNIEAILKGKSFEIPKRSINMALRTEIFYNGYEKGMRLYEQIRKGERHMYDFDDEEKELIKTGVYLIENDKVGDGLQVLMYSVQEFPNSSKALASLAEAYYKQGNAAKALTNFEKAYALDKQNKEALRMINALKAESMKTAAEKTQ